MAGFERAAQLLEERFASLWTAAPNYPVEWENAGEFKPPANGSWARFCVREDSSVQAELVGQPTPRRRRTGRVIVQCFTPKRATMVPLREMADRVAVIFDYQKLGTVPDTVQCRVTQATYVGASGGYEQSNATVPFYYFA